MISITATAIEPSHTNPIPHVGTQYRMDGGNYIYFTDEVAKQWISVLETITKEDNA